MSDSVAVDNVGVEVPASDQGSPSEQESRSEEGSRSEVDEAEPTEYDRSVRSFTTDYVISYIMIK